MNMLRHALLRILAKLYQFPMIDLPKGKRNLAVTAWVCTRMAVS